ncbi:MAG: methyltransferase domain-containing protein [Geitlerinemataceae cyanobacterium]
MNTDDSIERDFSPNSNRYDRPQLTFSSYSDVEWAIRPLSLQPHFRVLDVAAGSGQLSRAIAPCVRQVVALDCDRTKLDRGWKTARQKGITNIAVQRGYAENLPYADETFDLVMTGFALHHFERSDLAIAEMKRVCRKGGRVVVIDRIAPGNSHWATQYDRLEKLRDSSHIKLFKLYELKELFRDAGLSMVRSESRDCPIDFQSWIDFKSTAPELEYKLYVDLKQDIDRKRVTGMRPYWQDDRLFFLQIVARAIGQK